MPRKTLKQKLKKQLKQANAQLSVEHEQAGITINYELQAMQSVGMAHGVMATLLLVKQHLDIKSEQYKEIEKQSQARIAQCFRQLVGMGIDPTVANNRIMQGH